MAGIGIETFAGFVVLSRMRFRLFLPLVALPLALVARAEATPQDQIDELLRGRHWAAAQPLIEQALAREPQNAALHYALGQTLLGQNKGEAAATPLGKAAALAPTDSEYQRTLGDACGLAAMQAGMFAKLGWAKRCLAAYQKAVELDPRNLAARQSLLGFYQGAPSFVGGGMDKAYAEAEKIKQLDPAQGRIAYAGLYVADKKYDQAFGLFEEVLQATPDDYNALYQFGKLAAVTGQQLDRGLAALRRCLVLPPPSAGPGLAATHWRIGNILEKQGDKAGARTAYETALQVDPNFKQAAAALKKL